MHCTIWDPASCSRTPWHADCGGQGSNYRSSDLWTNPSISCNTAPLLAIKRIELACLNTRCLCTVIGVKSAILVTPKTFRCLCTVFRSSLISAIQVTFRSESDPSTVCRIRQSRSISLLIPNYLRGVPFLAHVIEALQHFRSALFAHRQCMGWCTLS